MSLTRLASKIFKSNQKEKVEIVASPKGNNVCQFVASIEFLPGKVSINRSSEWAKTPFASALFSLDGVSEMTFEKNRLMIRKESDASWAELGKKVGATIREFADTLGGNFFPNDLASTLQEDSSREEKPATNSVQNESAIQSDFGKKVLEILNDRIAPSLASHGGAVKLVDIKDKEIHLNFSGGCQGCSQVSTTVKSGIEQVLKQEFGDDITVVDVTNHSQGENPYY